MDWKDFLKVSKIKVGISIFLIFLYFYLAFMVMVVTSSSNQSQIPLFIEVMIYILVFIFYLFRFLPFLNILPLLEIILALCYYYFISCLIVFIFKKKIKMRKKNLILLIIGIFLAIMGFGIYIFGLNSGWFIPTEEIKLSVSSGEFPLAVSIMGPDSLINRLEDTPLPWSSCAFRIDWGDGSNKKINDSCDDLLHHVYTTPGNYLVKATAKSWKGKAKVSVIGDKQGPSLIKIISGVDTLYYYQKFPEPLVEFYTTKELALEIELINEDGTSLYKHKRKVSYDGQREFQIRAFGKEYDEKLRGGKFRFKVIASLMDGSNVISTDESNWFTASAEQKSKTINEDFILSTQQVIPLRVKASYRTFHPDCFGYELDWGDGSEKTTKLPNVKQNKKEGI